MYVFENVPIVTFSELLQRSKNKSYHRGGPIWPEWNEGAGYRHFRGNLPMDDKPTPAANYVNVSEPLCWCGPVTGHFGHQIANFSSRIPCYRDLDATYCFALKDDSAISSLDDCPQFFRELLAWFEIPPERVLLVCKPIIARKTYCAPQQEQIGSPPSAEFLEFLTALTRRSGISGVEKTGNYFIPKTSGNFGTIAGEAYVSKIAAQNGCKIVNPETLPLLDQLRLYASARTLVFTEGSALHGLQLLGRNIGDVHVLVRRPGTRLAEENIAPRCRSLTYHEIGDLVCGLTQVNSPENWKGITVPDSERLKNAFSKAGVSLSGFSEDQFQDAVEQNVMRWLELTSSSQANQVAGSMEKIHADLLNLGFLR